MYKRVARPRRTTQPGDRLQPPRYLEAESAKNCWNEERLLGSPGGVSSPGTVASSVVSLRLAWPVKAAERVPLLLPLPELPEPPVLPFDDDTETRWTASRRRW